MIKKCIEFEDAATVALQKYLDTLAVKIKTDGFEGFGVESMSGAWFVDLKEFDLVVYCSPFWEMTPGLVVDCHDYDGNEVLHKELDYGIEFDLDVDAAYFTELMMPVINEAISIYQKGENL